MTTTTPKEIVKTDSLPKPGDRITSGIVAKEVMVYPTREKYFSKDPYFGLLHILRDRLGHEEKYVVIGYSFRDDAINNAFFDAVLGTRKKIFLVNPDCP
jgi:hypothetical protein